MKKRLICAGISVGVLGIETLIALFVHDNFIRPYFGDVLAVVCVYFFARIFLPEKPHYLSAWVTAFAFCVELIQLSPLSEILPKPLNIIVGGTFDFKDLACYFVGGAGCFWIDRKFFHKYT